MSTQDEIKSRQLPPVPNQGKRLFVSAGDLGEKTDPSAFSTLEITFRPKVIHNTIGRENVYSLMALKRFLRVEYHEQAEAMRKIFENPLLSGSSLSLDYTGVGRPVFQIFQRSWIKAHLRAINITSGNHVTQNEDGVFGVPKKVLAYTMLGVIESGRLPVIAAKIPDIKAFFDECRAFAVKVTESKTEKFEGNGQHDDMVISLALALWTGENTALDWDGTIGSGGGLKIPQGVFADTPTIKKEGQEDHDAYLQWRRELGWEGGEQRSWFGVPDQW